MAIALAAEGSPRMALSKLALGHRARSIDELRQIIPNVASSPAVEPDHQRKEPTDIEQHRLRLEEAEWARAEAACKDLEENQREEPATSGYSTVVNLNAVAQSMSMNKRQMLEAVEREISTLEAIAKLLRGDVEATEEQPRHGRRKNVMTAEGRQAISDAQKLRWARVRKQQGNS